MIYMIVAVLVLIADQAVKLWTTLNIPFSPGEIITQKLIPGVVHMTNVHNYGAAFSILQNARWPLVAVTAVFVALIIILINGEIIHTRFGRWTASLVAAGAIGNCIDRILYGYVVDMFEFEFVSFPVFNIADIFITVSGVLFCLYVIFHNEPEEVRQANEPEFVRRRREAREAKRAEKEAPYARIPKRGEHRTLEEDIYSEYDPDDPFAEWELGGTVPAASAPEPEEAPAPQRYVRPEHRPEAQAAPAKASAQDAMAAALERELARRASAAAEIDVPAFEQPMPERRSAPGQTGQSAPAPAPARRSPADELEESFTYSLEDILSGFEDL